MITKILSHLSIITLLTGAAFAEGHSTTDPKSTHPTPSEAAKPLEKKDIDVIIYSSKSCSYCNSVKDVFKDKKIPYTEINVDNNSDKLKELEEKTGKKTVPQVIINGQHVGSYLDIVWGDVDELIKNHPSHAGQ